ncbi:MAG: monooxygenase, FAD-binding [Candidatus Solibacter sp.]|nr:monooxygenase, FAD-binding [Candidatus Solibacter sp.]
MVVGGGPAGLAAAIAARLQGLNVELIDAAVPPIDKACGEGILPYGVEVLRGLGVRLSMDDGIRFRGVQFIDGGVSVEVGFAGGSAVAVRRTRLHELLVERASQLGVRLRWGCTAAPPDLDGFRWIVGADGQNSCVREAAGLNAGSRESRRFGFRRHYGVAPWSEFVEVYWGSRCQVYVTPVGAEEVGVALLSRDSHLRLDAALTEFPELEERLRGAAVLSAERGAVTVSRRLRRVFGERTVLVGDASGSVDAITGEGLSLSFRQAAALAKAIVANDMEAYQGEHLRMMRGARLVERGLMLLERCPRLRRGVGAVWSWVRGGEGQAERQRINRPPDEHGWARIRGGN